MDCAAGIDSGAEQCVSDSGLLSSGGKNTAKQNQNANKQEITNLQVTPWLASMINRDLKHIHRLIRATMLWLCVGLLHAETLAHLKVYIFLILNTQKKKNSRNIETLEWSIGEMYVIVLKTSSWEMHFPF